MAKNDPPIEVTAARVAGSTIKFENGDTIDNNAWFKLYEERLGIKIKYDWLSPDQTSYNQKLNVSIASGSIPDIMMVDRVQAHKLIESDMLADLTEIYEKYASESTKKLMTMEDSAALKAMTFDGKLYGIPMPAAALDAAQVLWVRTDWLEKLNLPEPKTMEDFFVIAEAFTNQDPDGNNKKDTFGIALSKDLYLDAGMVGFLNGYHAYPQIWVKDESGSLSYGSIQPEMKAALSKLAELYKAGQIDREFGVKDGVKVNESISSGKVGMVFGPMYLSLVAMLNGKKLDSNTEWKAFPIPSIDGKPIKASVPFGVSNVFVASKSAEHPEAVVQLTNLSLEMEEDTSKETIETYNQKGEIEKWKYQPVYNTQYFNLDKYLTTIRVLKESNPDLSKLTNAEQILYEAITKYHKDGDLSGWGFERAFGPNSSQEVLYNYKQNNQLLVDEFIGVPTEVMNNLMPTLKKLEVEEFTKIIMGVSSVDSFDKFVENWMKLGGKQITQEVNDWKKMQ